MTRNIVIVALLACGGCAGEGWQHPWTKAKPETLLVLNPLSKEFRLHNSKNVDIKIDFIRASTPKGTELEMRGFQFRDNASDVRTADAIQIEATARLTEVITAPINKALDLAAPIVGAKINAPERGNPVQDAIKDRAAETIRTAPNPFITPGTPKITYTPKENQ